MSLTAALIVKNSYILAGILPFYKNVLDQTWKVFSTTFGPRWKERENSYQGRQILGFFAN